MRAKLEDEATQMIQTEKGYVIKPKRAGRSIDQNKMAAENKKIQQEFFETALGEAGSYDVARYQAKDLPEYFLGQNDLYHRVKVKGGEPGGPIVVENTRRHRFEFKPDQTVYIESPLYLEHIVENLPEKPVLKDIEKLETEMQKIRYFYSGLGITPPQKEAFIKAVKATGKWIGEKLDDTFFAKKSNLFVI